MTTDNKTGSLADSHAIIESEKNQSTEESAGATANVNHDSLPSTNNRTDSPAHGDPHLCAKKPLGAEEPTQSNCSTFSQPQCSHYLLIRSFTPKDAFGVKQIFTRHVRSLTLSLMMHYITRQFVDLTAFLGLVKLFVSWSQLACILCLLLVYIFCKARWELEYYLRTECRDMHDISNFYLEDEKSHIWVAEEVITQKSRNTSEKPGTTSRILGCVGVTPYKGDRSIAQLVRLVVSQESRRMRMGSRLAAQVENFAIEKSFREVRTYTNNLNTSAIKFLRQNGYEQVQVVKRGLMRGDLFLWRKILTKQAELDKQKSSHSVFGVFD